MLPAPFLKKTRVKPARNLPAALEMPQKHVASSFTYFFLAFLYFTINYLSLWHFFLPYIIVINNLQTT